MRTLQIKHFNIIKCDKGYIVHNTRHEFEKAHTHLRNLGYCKKMIYNILHHRKPKTKNGYLLESHLRVADDEKYIQMINDIQQKESKEKYINVQRGVRL